MEGRVDKMHLKNLKLATIQDPKAHMLDRRSPDFERRCW